MAIVWPCRLSVAEYAAAGKRIDVPEQACPVWHAADRLVGLSALAAPRGRTLDQRSGLVEGVGRRGAANVVVTRHPMAKPHLEFVDEVLAAFGG